MLCVYVDICLLQSVLRPGDVSRQISGSGIISVDASGELCCWDIPTYKGWASS